jgi:hypothetical protein
LGDWLISFLGVCFEEEKYWCNVGDVNRVVIEWVRLGVLAKVSGERGLFIERVGVSEGMVLVVLMLSVGEK